MAVTKQQMARSTLLLKSMEGKAIRWELVEEEVVNSLHSTHIQRLTIFSTLGYYGGGGGSYTGSAKDPRCASGAGGNDLLIYFS